MKLTPSILRNLYSAIYCMKPFDRWDMPLPEEVDFIVDQDPEVMGTYYYDDGGKFAHNHHYLISEVWSSIDCDQGSLP